MVAQGEVTASPARSVLMVRPAAFGFNPETAGTNVFQHRPDGGAGEQTAVHRRALGEFDGLVRVLREAGVEVVVVDDTPDPPKPDAVFPCNWVTFHANGIVVLYAMQSPARRPERRRDILELLRDEYGFEASRILDLSGNEAVGRFLEGAGSLVFDAAARTVYAGLSARTDPSLARHVASELEHDIVLFSTAGKDGTPIYHTDVVMTVGSRFAVVAAECIPDPDERNRVLDRLASTGRRLIPIASDQVTRFAGNLLELGTGVGEPVLVMSDAARAAFEPHQLHALEESGRIVHSNLSTIESVGGGSARCMIADIHLPRRR